jgi:transposase
VPTLHDHIPLAGLDVHANQSLAAVLDRASGALTTKRVVGPPSNALEFLESLGPGVRAVYEAGPTGFGLARDARERGIDLSVCSPSSIPRRNNRIKTDRRDAERLVRLFAAGELKLCRVPSVDEERFRDLVRAREDIRADLMRARHRMSKFLLRRDLRFGDRAGAWSTKHLNWLRRLGLEDPCSRSVHADYLSSIEALLQRRSALDQGLEELWPESPFAETVARLRCFRGINTLTACGIAAEVGDFERFPHPRKLSSYLGLVPSEWTSDERRRLGRITKAGPGHARWLLVEAAHHYRHAPTVRDDLKRRQAGQDPRVCAVAWRAQKRLHARYLKLSERRRTKAGVVMVALARELSSFIWEAATLA